MDKTVQTVQSQAGRSQRRAVIAVSVVYAALFVAWVVFNFGGTRVTQWIDDVGELIAPIVAAVACWRRGGRETGRAVRGWRLLGLSALSWGLGQAVWSYYELIAGRQVPFPSLADLGYLLAVPLALAGVLAFFSPPAGWTSRLRIVVDGLIVASAILFISWVLVLGATLAGGQGGWFERAIGLAYPVGDVVIVSAALLVSGRSQSDERLPLLWICGALIALSLSDSGFVYLTNQSSYSTGNLIDAGWIIGYLVLLVAACESSPPPNTLVTRKGERTLLPYVPVLAAMVLVGVRSIMGKMLAGFTLWDAWFVFLFVVIRQILTLRENRSLTTGLETKVEERTLELAASEQRLQSLISNVSDVITVVTPDGFVKFVSPSLSHVFGYEIEDWTDSRLAAFVHADDVPHLEAFVDRLLTAGASSRRLQVRIRHRDGSWRYAEMMQSEADDAGPTLGGIVLTTRDVSRRKELEDQLAHQAFHDSLTQLANRALFCNRIEHALGRIRRAGGELALVFLDLDDFKSVNDTLGHGQGDELLRQVGTRLSACVRPGDTVARLGGDEFAVLMEDTDEGSAIVAAKRFEAALSAPAHLGPNEILLSASVGVVVGDSMTESAAELLRNADVAMYRAKASGKARHEVFRPEMHDAVVRRVALQSELRQAVEGHQFTVHYQPLVTLADKRLVGFEALVRWCHPTRGMIGPVDFIAAAEETGLIIPIGRFVLEEAVAKLAEWGAVRASDDVPPLTMSVNVSGRQFQSSTFVQTVRDVLESTGVDPRRLTLELTESVLLEDVEGTIDRLRDLKSLGVRLAIDDFGTGFSSLSYLLRFPVDELKIDKSFIDDIVMGSRSSELARAVVELGHVLGLETIAEGIEDSRQASILEATGCRLGQGYLFHRPLRAQDVTALLRVAPVETLVG